MKLISIRNNEVDCWTNELNITEDQLHKAVKGAGSGFEKVKAYLEQPLN